MQVIKAELCCDIWLDFAMVTVLNSVVCMEMCRDSVFALLHKANFKVAFHFCLDKFSPNMNPFKTDLRLTYQSDELSNNTKQSLTSFLVFETCKLPQVNLEIIEMRYIMLKSFILSHCSMAMVILYRSFHLMNIGKVTLGYNDLLSQHSKS